MRRFLAGLVAACLLAVAVGCGGLTQEDMKRRAIRRPDSDAIVQSPQQQDASSLSPSKAPPATRETRSGGQDDIGQPSASQTAEASLTAAAAVARTEDNIAGGQNSAEPDGDVAQGTSPREERPRPVTPVERRARTIENLTRIGEAMMAYVADHGCYPTPAIYDVSGTPLLSWRVELLPYLGHKSLYEHFHFDEPWNSPRNAALLKEIPAVYRSPERDDATTNYLVPVGSGTMFPGRRGKTPAQIEDLPRNTVAVLEVDDALAVQWTRPAEYAYQPKSPGAGLGGLRVDGFFVVWGDGKVTGIPTSLTVQQLRPMYTADAGESFTSTQISQPATAEVVSEPEAPVVATASSTFAVNSGAEEPPSLHGQFATEARRALEEGRESDAARWYHALALTANADDELWRYHVRWAPRLGRPVLALRFGLGIRYFAPMGGQGSPNPIGRAQTSFSTSSQSGSKSLGFYTGELGDWVLDGLMERASQGRLGAMVQEASLLSQATVPTRTSVAGRFTSAGGVRSAATIGPGVVYLGEGPTKVLDYLADQDDVDVVVYFDIHVKSVGKGENSSTTKIRVVDRFGGDQLAETQSLNNLYVERLRAKPTKADLVEVTMNALWDRLDVALELEPLPAIFDEEHVVERVDWITHRRHEYPLPALMELRVYHLHGSLDRDELATHYRSVVGDEAARQLVFGRSSEQTEALTPWLPDVD